MRDSLSRLLPLMLLLAGLAAGQPAAIPCVPVNPRATPEARALLKTICAVSGKDAITGRDGMIEEAKRQYAAGSIITLMWHAVRPVDDEPNDWRRSVQGKLTDAEWSDLITPGTALHNRWLAQIDNVAQYLKRLQEAKVPVIWRPYHEANHGWAWWGGRSGEKGWIALYRLMFDRYVSYHHLNNLIWVWNSKTPGGPTEPFAGYNPGLQYCDILATDAYSGYPQSHHDELAALAQGKPIALGEVGTAPTPAILEQQPKWTWFMIWTDFFDNNNKREDLLELFKDPHTLSRGDPLPAGK